MNSELRLNPRGHCVCPFDRSYRSILGCAEARIRRDRFASGPADTASASAMSRIFQYRKHHRDFAAHGAARRTQGGLVAARAGALAGMIYLAVCFALLLRLAYG